MKKSKMPNRSVVRGRPFVWSLINLQLFNSLPDHMQCGSCQQVAGHANDVPSIWVASNWWLQLIDVCISNGIPLAAAAIAVRMLELEMQGAATVNDAVHSRQHVSSCCN